jgi:hypothetical protein
MRATSASSSSSAFSKVMSAGSGDSGMAAKRKPKP